MFNQFKKKNSKKNLSKTLGNSNSRKNSNTVFQLHSTPHCFKIQRGYHKRDRQTDRNRLNKKGAAAAK